MSFGLRNIRITTSIKNKEHELLYNTPENSICSAVPVVCEDMQGHLKEVCKYKIWQFKLKMSNMNST